MKLPTLDLSTIVSVVFTIIALFLSLGEGVTFSQMPDGIGSPYRTLPDQQTPDISSRPHQIVTINQGDRYITDEDVACSIGYIDRTQRVAYTAAHCVHTVDYSGKIGVYDTDGIRIGTFTYPDKYLPNTAFPSYSKYVSQGRPADIDITAIALDSNVIVGDNTYSGNTIIPLNTIQPGEKLCIYGAKSTTVYCGNIHKIYTDGTGRLDVEMPANRRSINGDSGGAAWIPGKGAVGTIGGTYSSWSGSRDNIISLGSYVYSFG